MTDFTPHCYTIEFLRRQLDAYEGRYGVASADFYDACVMGNEPDDLHYFDRLVWIDSYEEYVRLSELPRPVTRSPRAPQPVG